MRQAWTIRTTHKDFLPAVRAATLPIPLQWNQGSDISGCPSPRCPWAPALPAGPPADAAPEGHPRKVMWATGSQIARWSNPWPWSLGRRGGGRVWCWTTQRNDLYFPWIKKLWNYNSSSGWKAIQNEICWVLTDEKGRIYSQSQMWCWYVGVVGAGWLPTQSCKCSCNCVFTSVYQNLVPHSILSLNKTLWRFTTATLCAPKHIDMFFSPDLWSLACLWFCFTSLKLLEKCLVINMFFR